MSGWKTKASAIGVFGSGVAMIADGLTGETIDPNKIYQGLTICSGALAIVGIGHKIEKSGK